jgi:hypothetical protein
MCTAVALMVQGLKPLLVIDLAAPVNLCGREHGVLTMFKLPV